MGKLTKELLLQYANHSSSVVREAYYKRIAEEVLKEDGIIRFADIRFDEHDKALDVTVFYTNLYNCVVEKNADPKSIRRFCQIADQDKCYQGNAAYRLFDLVSYLNGTSLELNNFLNAYMPKVAPSYYDSSLICSLLAMPQIPGFISLAKKRAEYLSAYYPEVIDALEELPAEYLDDALDIVEILLPINDSAQSRSLLSYLGRILKKQGLDFQQEKTQRKKRFFKVMLEAVLSLDYGNSKEIETINSELFAFHRDALLSDNVMADILEYEFNKMVLGQERYISEALNRLMLLIGKDIMVAVRFSKILSNLMPKCRHTRTEILFTVIRIIYALTNKQFTAHYVGCYDLLYRQNLAAFNQFTRHQAIVTANIAIELENRELLLHLVGEAPFYEAILEKIAEKKPDWWLPAFESLHLLRIDDKEFFTGVLIYLSDKFPALRKDIGSALEKTLDIFRFSERQATEIQKMLDNRPILSFLQVKGENISVEEVSEILALLEE